MTANSVMDDEDPIDAVEGDETDEDSEDAEPGATVVYSAELLLENGRYTLIVRDRVRGTVQVSHVAKKAVDKLPFYLSMLGSPAKRFRG